MSWITLLSDAYDVFYKKFGNVDAIKEDFSNGKRPLLPLYHKEQLVQLEITLDSKSEVVSIATLSKNEQSTIIPCSFESGNRTSGIVAHPLTDSLEYIAGDLKNYLSKENLAQLEKEEQKVATEDEENQEDNKEIESDKKVKNKDTKSKNEEYLEQLLLWSESEYATDKVKIIYKYLAQKCLIQDLIKFNIVANQEGNILFKYDNKNNEKKYVLYDLIQQNKKGDGLVKVFVRFRVLNKDAIKECYYDEELFKSWQGYYGKIIKGHKDFCYASGQEEIIPELHDKYIRYTGDGAKLFSGNDSQGFTYRGRFSNPHEASCVGVQTSAKMHNALKWLISRQAFRKGDFCFLVWSNDILDIPSFLNSGFGPEEENKTLNTEEVDTADTYAKNFKNFVKGYEKIGTPNSSVIMLGLNSATSGRLSVIYFNFMSVEDYITKIMQWYDSVKWLYFYKGEVIEQTPRPNEIAQAMFGYGKQVKDELLNKFYERLIFCILNDTPIPKDFVQKAVNRTGMKISCKDIGGQFNNALWQKALSTTCALIRKYYKEENYLMELEEKRTTRSYVFGRLLAVADYIEDLALWKDGIKRTTMATRVFNNFASNPATTWQYLRQNLNVYLSKLNNNGSFYKNLIDKISNILSAEDFSSNVPLNPEYLIGYSHQMMSFRTKKESQEQNLENKEEGEK